MSDARLYLLVVKPCLDWVLTGHARPVVLSVGMAFEYHDIVNGEPFFFQKSSGFACLS